MALQATIYNFDIELADNDRAVYESLALRLARHPSESDEHLIARLLAYLLEFTSGIAFSRGVSEPDEPAIAVRDPTGAITTWIDIGSPDAGRLHKASKAAPRVVVYTHKEPRQFLNQLAGEKSIGQKRWSYMRSIAHWSPRSSRDLNAASVSVCRLRRASWSLIATENLTGSVVRLKRDTDHST